MLQSMLLIPFKCASKPTEQEADEDSDSEGAAGSTLDSTYECISSLPSTAAEGMNDTMVLVARLDSAGLDSPAPAQISNSPTERRFAFATIFS